MIPSNFLFLCIILICGSQCYGVDPTGPEMIRLCKGYDYQKVPHPKDEDKYIQCTKIPIVGVCRPNQVSGQTVPACFDKDQQTCTDCPYVTNDKPDDRSAFYAQFICTQGYDTLPGNDCKHFFLCTTTSPFYEYRTCKPGFEYSMEQGMCSKDAKCNIKGSGNNTTMSDNQKGRGLCGDNDDGTRYAHETDCNKYFMCLESRPFEMRCEKNSNYDSNLKSCVRGPCRQSGKN